MVLVLCVGILTLGTLNVAYSQQSGGMKLPVSLNAAMVALTDKSAEPFWTGAQNNPTTQQDWDELEYYATQLAISGVVITIPGTGPSDSMWVNQVAWQNLSKQLTDISMKGLTAVRAKDRDAIKEVGNNLVDVCESCHRLYKPDIPTQGIIMHSEYYRPGR